MPQNQSKIEDIKRRLYDRVDSISKRTHEGVLHPIARQISSEWKKEETEKDNFMAQKLKKAPLSIFAKFFIGACIFFVCAMLFAFFMFVGGGSKSVSNDNIDITVLGNAFTKGGDVLPLQIEIVNRNKASLELADLIIEYPSGADDNPNDVIRLPRNVLGTIKSGASITTNAKVSLYGEEKSIRNVKISLEYHPEGSNAIFTKEKEYPVTISSAPLSLLLDAPDQATSDQPVTIKVTASLNTTLPDAPTMLQMTYPSGFIYESATPAPMFNNSVWSLASLSQTHPVVVTITGKFVGQTGDEQVFHAYAGATSPTNQAFVSVVYTSLLKSLTLSKPFLEADILVNGQETLNPTASGGETINGSISWANNLSTRITDAQIILNMTGNALDKNSVNPLEGFYDSANSRIVWDKNSIADLGSIEPGASGTVSFTFKSLSLVGSSIKDPQVGLDVSIKGLQPSLGSTFQDVNNFSKKVVKILSDLQIATNATYNSGSMPPKVETETKYNVTWTLSNSANAVSGAVAKSVLPIYIKWVGAQAGTNENISYNDITREVIWNIGSVRPNTGFDSNREVTFILSLNPSLSQAGSVPQLMKDVILSGKDLFSNTIVNSKHGPITTQLSNDPNFKPGGERVSN